MTGKPTELLTISSVLGFNQILSKLSNWTVNLTVLISRLIFWWENQKFWAAVLQPVLLQCLLKKKYIIERYTEILEENNGAVGLQLQGLFVQGLVEIFLSKYSKISGIQELAEVGFIYSRSFVYLFVFFKKIFGSLVKGPTGPTGAFCLSVYSQVLTFSVIKLTRHID